MPIYDITHPLDSRIAVWPGDAPYLLQRTCTLQEGASVNLSEIRLSVHCGTHADAPWHFDASGVTIEALSLEPYLGPAVVIDVSNHETIRIQDIPASRLAGHPRVLLCTNACTDETRFPERIPVLEQDVPAYLGEQGVVLLGLDVPSVDALDSKELPLHHALHRSGIHILENLRLKDVPEGEYELIALPLRLNASDGSPVRAILRSHCT